MRAHSQASEHCPVLDAVKGKERAEQSIRPLLAKFRQHAQEKIVLCQDHQLHNSSILQGVAAGKAELTGVSDLAATSERWPFAHVKERNYEQLAGFELMLVAFKATERAREQLQACLRQELTLVEELYKPVELGLQQSMQILQTTADKLQLHDPQREQRHTEMLLRCGTGFGHVACIAKHMHIHQSTWCLQFSCGSSLADMVQVLLHRFNMTLCHLLHA